MRSKDAINRVSTILLLCFAFLLFIELQLFFVAFLYLERKQTDYIKQLIFTGCSNE